MNCVDTVLSEKTFRLRDDIGQMVEIELSPLRPQLITRKHEFGFSLSYDLDGPIGIRHGFDQAAYLSRDQEVHIYPIPQGMEMEVVLLRKPKTNRFPFHVRGNVSFHKQVGACAGRPENVVDSFAIYCDKKHNQYGTGKIGHIYRAEAHDAQGHRTWCQMDYAYGCLTVTIPWAFMNDARYPVVVDPTLGYNTIGGTTSSSDTYIDATIYQMPEPGTVTQFNVYVETNTGNMTCGIYNSTSSSVGGQSRVAQTAGGQIPGIGAEWKAQSISAVLSSGHYYGLAVTVSSPLAGLYYDLVSHARSTQTPYSYSDGNLPNPFPASIDDTAASHSWYIDYAAGSTFKRSKFLIMFPV